MPHIRLPVDRNEAYRLVREQPFWRGGVRDIEVNHAARLHVCIVRDLDNDGMRKSDER